jgi:hypothetical protein
MLEALYFPHLLNHMKTVTLPAGILCIATLFQCVHCYAAVPPDYRGTPFHKWNKAEVGSIEFKEAGIQLLTFFYSRNNYAYFDFEPMDEQSKP